MKAIPTGKAILWWIVGLTFLPFVAIWVILTMMDEPVRWLFKDYWTRILPIVLVGFGIPGVIGIVLANTLNEWWGHKRIKKPDIGGHHESQDS
jgi:hypothetical protein